MARCARPALPLSTLTLFSDWHPRAWEFTWLDLPAFLLHWLSGSAGQCYRFVDHLSDHTLRDPMLHFLAILSAIDPALSTSSVPQMLDIFWFDAHEIDYGACVAQMFSIHTFTRMESAGLLAMGFDCFVAICVPLQYTTILTPTVLVGTAVGIIMCPVLLMLRTLYLTHYLPFCEARIIDHFYSEHMGIAKLPCASIQINAIYGLFVSSFLILDVALVGISYAYILCAGFCLPSQDARHKALSTCGSHVGVYVFSIHTLFLLSHPSIWQKKFPVMSISSLPTSTWFSHLPSILLSVVWGQSRFVSMWFMLSPQRRVSCFLSLWGYG